MFKSLVVASLFALGVVAQDLPDFKSVPKECESKCKDAGIESACGSIDNSDGCLKTVCKDTAKVKPCLDCAKMGDLYNTLVSLCKDQSGDETGDSSGGDADSAGSASSAATAGASDSASKDGKSGATGLAASGAGIAAAAMLAVYF